MEMDITKLKDSEIAEIDLHGMTAYEAEEHLILFLENLPKNKKAVIVTHGYSRGTVLKKMVKQEFYHWRIKNKSVGLNPGVTYFWLK